MHRILIFFAKLEGFVIATGLIARAGGVKVNFLIAWTSVILSEW